MTSPWNECEKIMHKTAAPTKTTEVKLRKNRILSFTYNKNDSVSPLAKKLKGFKDKKIIEKIVKDRQDRMPSSREKILHIPMPASEKW